MFTSLFSAIFLQQYFPLPVYLSLLPVIGGVAFASLKEVSCYNFLCILASCVCHAMYTLPESALLPTLEGNTQTLQHQRDGFLNNSCNYRMHH